MQSNALLSQAYIFNIPIGQNISGATRDVVKLGNFLWKFNERNIMWSAWVRDFYVDFS